MLGDTMYTQMMSGIIAGDTNLQMDLLARSLGDEVFNDYVDGMYDSSEDYWRVHEDGTISWDGHLNFYKDGETDINDATAGMKLDYRELDKEIAKAEKAGKSKVVIGGVEVELSRLKEIQGHNERIIQNAQKSNRASSKDLLDDGFIKYGDAVNIYDKEIHERFVGGKKSTKELFDSIPDMVEHYSVRYILNGNDKFKNYFSNQEVISNWTSDVVRGESVKELFGETAHLLPVNQSVYHGLNAYKWVFDNGQEIVFGSILDSNYIPTNNYKFEKDDRYLGTYNWFNAENTQLHTYADVLPYWAWGNSPDDNNPKLNRVYPMVETYEDSKRREYYEKNKYSRFFVQPQNR